MKNRPMTRLVAAGLAFVLLGVAACSDDGDEATDDTIATTEVADGGDETTTTAEGDTPDDTGAPAEGATLTPELAGEVATTYADLVLAEYDASATSATALHDAIDTFVAAPSQEGLDAAKTAWLAARDDYGITEVFRFYDGPIDNPDDGPEGQINAWPMDEAYVDYTEDDPEAGLVADAETLPEITAETIAGVNEQGGETNVSTGWHAIEFLLWGQDLSEDGPGARPLTDYTDDANAERRGQYLAALADLLVADIEGVRDQWAADGGAYREEFLSDPDQAVTNILRGMGALSAGELAGERILVAYDTQDQEDEHSCFSDNTNADVYLNARGIELAYTADFEGVEGTSLQEAIAEVNPELNDQLTESLQSTVTGAADLEALGTFDQIIADDVSREQLREEAEGLQAQGDIIAELAASLGYEISLDI